MDGTLLPALIIGGVLLNILISSGALWKLISFAEGYGKLTEKVNTHETEINRLREFSHELRDGKIPVKVLKP